MRDEEPIGLNDPDYEDPILEEIWRAREENFAEFDYDIGAMVRATQEEESRMDPALFGSPPRRGHR